MRLGILSDVHGVEPALRAVLEDGDRAGVDRWWALGDLVLFGPQPVEVLQLLHDLPHVAFVSGNTDRYVMTDDQPQPHATAEAAVGDVDLVRRYGLMAAGAAWTRGVLDQAGVLDLLDDLPRHQRLVLDDGTRLLGVHASPGADDGPVSTPHRRTRTSNGCSSTSTPTGWSGATPMTRPIARSPAYECSTQAASAYPGPRVRRAGCWSMPQRPVGAWSTERLASTPLR